MVQLCDLIARPQAEACVYVHISLYVCACVRMNKFGTK